MNNRVLGTIFMVGTLGIIISGFRTASWTNEQVGTDTLVNLAYLVWGFGGVCGFIGLIRAGALGQRPVARALGFLPILGFGIMFLVSFLELVGVVSGASSTYNLLGGIAWITLLAGLLVSGILVVAAKVWQGWRRFVPLASGLAAPLGFAIGGAIGNLAVGGLIAYVFWLILAYVIATSESTVDLQQARV